MKSTDIVLLFHFKYSTKYIIEIIPQEAVETIYFLKIVVKIYGESKSWLCAEPKEPPKPIAINPLLKQRNTFS